MINADGSRYPPELNDVQYEYLLSETQNWALLNGLAVKTPVQAVPFRSEHANVITAAPVTLFPSLVPQHLFTQARELQCAYNELYAWISQDADWVCGAIAEFLNDLWEIFLKIEREGIVQDVSLGIFRSDYMMSDDPDSPAMGPQLKQVEFNTIAASFGGLSEKVSQLHQSLTNTYAYPLTAESPLSAEVLPHNESIRAIASGLQAAHTIYGPSKSSRPLPLCVIFIVQDQEVNIFDQYALANELLQRYSTVVFRVSFERIFAQLSIPSDNANRPLIYNPPHLPTTKFEVTTVYFRAGYSPSDYTSRTAWDARHHIERSAAIKCPDVLTHLAGSKKVQQVLATPDSKHLEDFLKKTPHEGHITRLRDTFATLYPLDRSSAGMEGLNLALHEERSKGWVLKPQREGGGNNVYGAKIPSFLSSLEMDVTRQKAFILMEMLHPRKQANTILRNGQATTTDVINELGVYGVCMWRHDYKHKDRRNAKILLNQEAGFLLRTKPFDSEEGGVAAGFGAVDSPCLHDPYTLH